MTKKSGEKPPLTPKPVVQKAKLTFSQLQDKTELLELELAKLLKDSSAKDAKIQKMEERITQLEVDQMRNASYFAVQRNVSDLLSKRVAQLEQYTRRYCVAITGIDRIINETQENLQEELNKLHIARN